jgi:hypothetical protein
MSRERLGNRRRCETIEFCHAGHAFTLSTGRFRDGRLAEVFINSSKHIGSPLESLARDSAILASLALQAGIHVETLRHALTRDHDGSPATALGAALDLLCGE